MRHNQVYKKVPNPPKTEVKIERMRPGSTAYQKELNRLYTGSIRYDEFIRRVSGQKIKVR